MSVEPTGSEQVRVESFDGGFRRVSRPPEPQALVHARALLLDLARDGAPLLRNALGSFESWVWLATLCHHEWGAVRASAPTLRLLKRRFMVLGTAPVPLARAAQMPVGAAVHVVGTIRPMLPSRLNAHMSYIWSRSAMTSDNVRVLTEEGHDFFLVDDEGQTARVIAKRGYLLNAMELPPGTRLSVFGHVDRIAVAAAPPAREDSALALRAGDDTPLLLRVAI